MDRSVRNLDENLMLGSRTRPVRFEHTEQRRKIVRKKDGLGGFMESLFAIMVVTVAFLLLTSALVIVSDAGKEDGSAALKREIDRLRGEILSDPALFIRDGVIDMLKISAILSDRWLPRSPAIGLFVFLTETEGTVVELGRYGNFTTSVERSCITEPISLFFCDTDVRSGTLSIWIW